MKALTLAEIDQLGELLASVPEPCEPMEPDFLDGFLSAIALMENPPASSDWLPLTVDLSESGSEVAAKALREGPLRGLILTRGAELEACMLAQKPIDPVIFEDDEFDDPLEALSPFSDGFMLACVKWTELLENKNPGVQAALVGILRYATRDEDDQDEELVEEVRFANLDEALEDLLACLQEVADVTREHDIRKASVAPPKSSKGSKRPPRRR